MADYEVSKIMWVAIVVALAASIFVVAKPQVTSLAEGVFDNVAQVVNGTSTGNDDNSEKVVASADYGKNAILEVNDSGQATVRPKDNSNIIEGVTPFTELKSDSLTPEVVDSIKTLDYSTKVKIVGDEASGTLYGTGLFQNSSLESIDVSNFDTSEATDLSGMFNGATQVKTITGLDKLDVSKVTRLDNFFMQCGQLTNAGDLSNWDVSNVNYFNSMFMGTSNLKSVGDLEKWQVSDAGKSTASASQGSQTFAMSGLDVPSWGK